MSQLSPKPDYGIDAPAVMRNMFVFGALAIALIFVTPSVLHVGKVFLAWHRMLGWTGGFLLAEGFLFLLYVEVGKFRHRDLMLEMHTWTGEEQVLDVGCGRGLLLAGAAKRLSSKRGHATGIDISFRTTSGRASMRRRSRQAGCVWKRSGEAG